MSGGCKKYDDIWKQYIQHVSASQIKTHERNPRKWALEKLLKLPTCGSYATEFGSAVHGSVEAALMGEPAPDGETELIASLTADILEALGSLVDGPMMVESSISVSEPGLPPFIGYIDAYVPEFHGGCPLIIDHKTSRTRRYFLKPRQLKFDDQMMIYAKWALTQRPHARGVWLQHNQVAYSLKKNRVNVARTYACKERIEQHWAGLCERLAGGIVSTIRTFHESGIHAIPRLGCADCKCAYGPNSCEFAPICDGMLTPDDYVVVYGELSTEGGRPKTIETLEAAKRYTPRLTKIEESDIIKVETKGESTMRTEDKPKVYTENDMVPRSQRSLSELVAKARERYKDVTNTWDRREAMTRAVVQTLLESPPSIVLLPSHFIGGTIDPDYQPIVTQLKEAGIRLAVEL